jgi:peptidoglycan/LPS O-acetylase OafA/YrhL
MADLQRSSGRGLSRRERVDRAYRLTLATGGFAVAAVVTFVLALFTGLSAAWPLIAAVLAVVCGLMLRRSLGR